MLTLICGRCRAGKTTFSARFDNVIHLDEVSKSGRERYPKVKEIVSATSGDIVVEGIYETKSIRKELLDAYMGQGARCVWLDTPEDIILARMTNLKIVVPRHFEPPALDEGWDEVIVIRGDDSNGCYR